MYKLNLETLIKKIAAVDHRAYVTYVDRNGKTQTYRRWAMDKGWMDIWRREWEFLWVGLDGNDDPRAINIRHKLCGGYSEDGTMVQYRNKLYLTKDEMPWLIEWIKEHPACLKCDKHTNEIFCRGHENNDGFCRQCWEGGAR